MYRFMRRMSVAVLSYVRRAGSSRYNVEYVDGFAPPRITLEARSYYWTTPGGRPVRHPNAYRRAFGRPVYHKAKRGTIRVGKGWAIQHAM